MVQEFQSAILFSLTSFSVTYACYMFRCVSSRINLLTNITKYHIMGGDFIKMQQD